VTEQRTSNGQDGRRDAIVREATELFSQSYETTTMRVIGAAVGIDSATIYYYFPSKQAILQEIIEVGLSRYVEELEEIRQRSDTFRARLRAAVHAHVRVTATEKYIDLHERYHQLLPSALTLEAQKDTVERTFQELLTLAATEAGVEYDEDPVTRLYVLGGLNVFRWYRPDARLSIDEIGDRSADLVERCIGIAER
jgi:AcrR family transcriptional regulator